ncbi:MAG: chemotaxis protein CheA [Brevinematia bacterium]
MKFDFIISILKELSDFISTYEEGDLIKLVSIRDDIGKLKGEFEKFEELKKLNVLLEHLQIIAELASKSSIEELTSINIIGNVVNDFLSFFSKKTSGHELVNNLNSYSPEISRLTRKAKKIAEASLEKDKSSEEEYSYPSDYFKALVDDTKLLTQFYEETTEHLDQAQYTLLELEYDPRNKELINNIFRNFHTIKGSSAFLGLKNIEDVSHSMEDLLALVRDEKIFLSKELIDIIFYGMELLRNILDIMLANEFKTKDLKRSFLNINIFPFIKLMKRILNEYQYKKIGEILEEEGKITSSDIEKVLSSQKVSQKKFGEIVLEEKIVSSEELLSALQKQKKQESKIKKLGFVKVSNEKLNTLIDIVGELVINQSMLKQEILQNGANINISERTLSQLEMITTTIKNLVLSMGMVPIADIFNKLRVVARNTAQELGKVVFLEIKGEETELDRNVIETIYDPLMHIIRNAIDHGIESPEEREKLKKDKTGKIFLSAEHKGSGIEITIADDGKGIDKQKVIERALELRLIERDKVDTMSEKDIYNILFLPGFSINREATNISGRGVGLDVVKKNLEKIHGRVEVYSELGKYTKFVIKLPLTLAIIEGFVTRVGNNKYVFPFNMIEEILVLNKSEIKVSEQNNKEENIIYHRGIHIPVIFAHRIFKEQPGENEKFISLIFNIDNFKYCMIVDEVLGKQEIVVKNLGSLLSEYKYFSGGTIFGDGSIGFVVDLQGILEVA